MERCDACGAVLPADTTDCPDCTHSSGSKEPEAGSQPSESESMTLEEHASTSSPDTVIEVSGSVIRGDIGNEVTGPASDAGGGDGETECLDDLVETYEKWTEVKDREARTEARRVAELEQLEERVELELERERLALQERRQEIEAERREDRSQASVAALLLEADDEKTIEALQSLEASDAGAEAPEPDDGTVEAVQILEVLATIDREAASNDPDLSELYVSLEKAVRLLGTFDEGLRDDMDTYLEQHRFLTDGISSTDFTDSEREELRTLCDRARDAIVTELGGRA